MTRSHAVRPQLDGLENHAEMAGKGDDSVTLTSVRSYGSTKVVTDNGRDTVATTDVQASKDAVFDGGDEFDTFIRRGFLRGGERE
ncbi:MAG: hypothetical protein WKF75_08225 [Singulisphaera sp.]